MEDDPRPLKAARFPRGSVRSHRRQHLSGLQPMELDWRIASLIGAGLTDDRITSELGVDKKLVTRVRRSIPEDPDLKRVVDEARERLMDRMLEGAERALERAVTGLDGYVVSAGRGETVTVDCQPQQAIAVFRELAKATGLGAPPTAEVEQTETKRIDFQDPQQRSAALKALQQSALEAERKLSNREPAPRALPSPLTNETRDTETICSPPASPLPTSEPSDSSPSSST